MTAYKKLKQVLPYVILLALVSLLYRELFYSEQTFKTQLIGESLPQFNLQDLHHPKAIFSNQSLPKKIIILNVWASWCYACGLEQSMLMKISRDYHVPVYGINYKDNATDALRWLKKHGNPFQRVGSDKTGSLMVDLGVYGIPESFILNQDGKIIYKHLGIINQKNWDETLYPIIKKYA